MIIYVIYIFIALAILLLIHHYYSHPELPLPDRLFQLQDISNHETYILIFLAVAFTLAICSFFFC